MYLIVIGWLCVTLLMALAEAFSSQGSVLGAVITFILYGLLPMSLVVYLGGTPLRRKSRIKADTQQPIGQDSPESIGEPDAGSHATGLSQDRAVAAVRKVP